MKILFCCRSGCGWSSRLYKEMISSGHEVVCFASETRQDQLPSDVSDWGGDLIISYRCLTILPTSLINNAAIAAINFHPGSPNYPGTGCVNFALYDRADVFGVTMHLMTEPVDSGQILKVIEFPIAESDTVDSLLARTHEHLGMMCLEFVKKLSSFTVCEFNSLIASTKDLWAWTGKRRSTSTLDTFQIVNLPVSAKELSNRIRAFHTEYYPLKLRFNKLEVELI